MLLSFTMLCQIIDCFSSVSVFWRQATRCWPDVALKSFQRSRFIQWPLSDIWPKWLQQLQGNAKFCTHFVCMRFLSVVICWPEQHFHVRCQLFWTVSDPPPLCVRTFWYWYRWRDANIWFTVFTVFCATERKQMIRGEGQTESTSCITVWSSKKQKRFGVQRMQGFVRSAKEKTNWSGWWKTEIPWKMFGRCDIHKSDLMAV